MRNMKTLFLLISICTNLLGFAQEKQTDKLVAATKVVNEFAAMKDKVPKQLLNISEGIMIIPKMINAGLGIAGKRGKGIAIVKNADGSWSNPVFVTITGGSVGFQAGIQSVDLVLIFTKSETLVNIGNGSFTLGGDVSVTAGPVGRNSSASTDYKFEAEVYSYSKSKGLFAGISISGSAIDIDEKAISKFYGEELDAKTLFESSGKDHSEATTGFIAAVQQMYKQ